MKMQKKQGRLERRAYGIVLTAVFVAAVVILNVLVMAFSDFYGWYFYVTPQYMHETGGMSDAFLENEDKQQVDIIFCMERDALEADTVYNLVLQTARQMEADYDFIRVVDNKNIYLDPQDFTRYQTVYDQDGNLIGKQTITKDSVIFDAGDNFTVFRMSDFFFLSSEQVIESYNGEEAMASGIRYVLDDTRPIAYFTQGHGEQLSSAYIQMFACAGYDVRMIDLSRDKIDARATIIVCMNPLYDFEKAAAGSGLHTDMESLENFLLRGGSFYLFLDPYVKDLKNLSGLIASYGLSVDDSILRVQAEDAVSIDGYAFMPSYAQSKAASVIASSVQEACSARPFAKDVAPLILNADNERGALLEPLLNAGNMATPYQSTEPSGAAGIYPFSALASASEESGGGKIFLMSGIFMTAQDILQSDQRANRDFFYSVMEYTEGKSTPRGATVLVFESMLLENLTVGESNRYTRILTLWLPLAVMTTGIFIVKKRKRA